MFEDQLAAAQTDIRKFLLQKNNRFILLNANSFWRSQRCFCMSSIQLYCRWT